MQEGAGKGTPHAGRTTTWMVAARPRAVTTVSRNIVLPCACSSTDTKQAPETGGGKPPEIQTPVNNHRPAKHTCKRRRAPEISSNLPESDHIAQHMAYFTQDGAVAKSVSEFSPGPDE